MTCATNVAFVWFITSGDLLDSTGISLLELNNTQCDDTDKSHNHGFLSICWIDKLPVGN